MIGIIITPIWNLSTFHPHNRRISQWIEAFGRNKLNPIVISLNGYASYLHNNDGQYDLILGEHPIVKNGNPIRKRKLADIKVIVERIKDLIQENRNILKKAKVVLICHPMLLECIKEFECKKIIDFPDAPQSENDILKWGFHSKSEFFAYLMNCEITLLHNAEASYLKRHGFDIEKINIVSPTISDCQPPTYGSQPNKICFHGRQSAQTLATFINLFNIIKDNPFFLESKLKIKVCGEMSNLIPLTLPVENIGCVKNLPVHLHNAICPVLTKNNPTGISYRVLDIVESGGFLIASSKSIIGYPITDYQFLYDDIYSIPSIIEKITYNVDIAVNEMKQLQKLFINMSNKSQKTLDEILSF